MNSESTQQQATTDKQLTPKFLVIFFEPPARHHVNPMITSGDSDTNYGSGSSFFREDFRRLTVCKQWFRFARTACFKDPQLSQSALRRLLSSSDVEEKNMLLVVKDSLEILDLKLKGFEDWSSIPEPQSYPQEEANALDLDASRSRDEDFERALLLLAAWTAGLDNDLARLAAIITKESRKLRILRIQASSEFHPLLPLLHRRDYLSLPTIRALLLVNGPRAGPMWHFPDAATTRPP
jgi:hypothetical protein